MSALRRRLNWAVLDWDTPAIEFYCALGAHFLDEWRNVRLASGANGPTDNEGTKTRPAGSVQ